MSSYDALASSYDGLMVDVEYRRRADYLTRQFRRSALPVETVLDLAWARGPSPACWLNGDIRWWPRMGRRRC